MSWPMYPKNCPKFPKETQEHIGESVVPSKVSITVAMMPGFREPYGSHFLPILVSLITQTQIQLSSSNLDSPKNSM